MTVTVLIRYEIDPFQRDAFRECPEGRANFAMAQEKRFILREERTFTEVVDSTFQRPAQ